MDENLSAKLAGQERILGRRVLFVLPVLVILVIVTFLYMALPVRYFFSTRGDQLCLMAGRFGRVDAQQCQSLEPVSSKGMDLGGLTGRVFESEGDALLAMRSFFLKRIDEQNQRVFALEKELAEPYTALLNDLRAAKAAGMEGLERNIDVLQGWTEIYQKKAGVK